MRRYLTLNGTPIWNLHDLQKNFSPLPLLEQLEAFHAFAQVRCASIPLLLSNLETGGLCRAECLTKDFWLEALCREGQPGAGTEDCLAELKNQALAGDEDEDSQAPAFEREAAWAQLAEKLELIARAVQEGTDGRTLIRLLAVCELVEKDPRRTEASAWRPAPAGGAAPGEGQEPVPFPYDQEAYLPVRTEKYRYWAYGDHLDPGDALSTVRVEAVAGANAYACVTLEIYSGQKPVETVTLKKGEFRYCLAAGGKIVKFLPTLALNNAACISRPDYARSELHIHVKGQEPWSLPVEGASSFALLPGDSKGFLLVSGGRVNASFSGILDHATLQLMEMLYPVVEACAAGNTLEFLCANGDVLAMEIPGIPRRCRKGVPSLAPRQPVCKVSGLGGPVREAAVSPGGHGAAVLYGGDREVVDFTGSALSVRRQNGQIELYYRKEETTLEGKD